MTTPTITVLAQRGEVTHRTPVVPCIIERSTPSGAVIHGSNVRRYHAGRGPLHGTPGVRGTPPARISTTTRQGDLLYWTGPRVTRYRDRDAARKAAASAGMEWVAD